MSNQQKRTICVFKCWLRCPLASYEALLSFEKTIVERSQNCVLSHKNDTRQNCVIPNVFSTTHIQDVHGGASGDNVIGYSTCVSVQRAPCWISAQVDVVVSEANCRSCPFVLWSAFISSHVSVIHWVNFFEGRIVELLKSSFLTMFFTHSHPVFCIASEGEIYTLILLQRSFLTAQDDSCGSSAHLERHLPRTRTFDARLQH